MSENKDEDAFNLLQQISEVGTKFPKEFKKAVEAATGVVNSPEYIKMCEEADAFVVQRKKIVNLIIENALDKEKVETLHKVLTVIDEEVKELNRKGQDLLALGFYESVGSTLGIKVPGMPKTNVPKEEVPAEVPAEVPKDEEMKETTDEA